MKSKTTSKVNSSKETPEQIALEIYELALSQTLGEMRHLQSGVSKPRGEYSVTEAVSYLAKQAVTFAAEHRKAKAAALRYLDKLTRAQVMTWFRTQLDAVERASMVREIQRIDQEAESVLR